MKRATWIGILSLGVVAFAVGGILAIAEGIAADETGRQGNVIPFIVLLIIGALVAVVGFVGICFSPRREQRRRFG